MATWHKQWKAAYKRDPQSLHAFGLWLRFTKGWSQLEIQELDMDDDDHFSLLEQYGNDPEIARMSEECREE